MSQNTLEEKVPFDFIRYANCWEDAHILIEGLNPQSGHKILSIGSAGDNSFSLLTRNPEMVVAVDINASQLYLIALKKTCFQHLDYETTLQFLGFKPCNNRLDIFKSISQYLDNDANRFWKYHYAGIEKGIIHSGKFEKYFQYFVKKVLPFIHNKKTTAYLLKPKSAEEQLSFYNNTWNSWRWRLLFKIFFSKWVMGRLGRDPQFLKEVTIPVATYIFNQAERTLSNVQAQENFILKYNLQADFGNLLPHYLQESNFYTIKNNIDALHLEQGYADAVLNKYGKMNGMNLSNIFEYMDMATFENVSQSLLNGLESGGRMAYWNLMVIRMISKIFPKESIYLDHISNKLSSKDMGFFYHQFIVEQKL